MGRLQRNDAQNHRGHGPALSDIGWLSGDSEGDSVRRDAEVRVGKLVPLPMGEVSAARVWRAVRIGGLALPAASFDLGLNPLFDFRFNPIYGAAPRISEGPRKSLVESARVRIETLVDCAAFKAGLVLDEGDFNRANPERLLLNARGDRKGAAGSQSALCHERPRGCERERSAVESTAWTQSGLNL